MTDEKLIERFERQHRIFVKFKTESEAEIASLRAKLDCAEDMLRESDKLAAETNAKLEKAREALKDAIDGFEDASQYKGEYLAKKHGDAEEIAQLRATLEALK